MMVRAICRYCSLSLRRYQWDLLFLLGVRVGFLEGGGRGAGGGGGCL